MLAGAAKRNKESISFAENCITEHNAESHEFPLRKYTYFCPKTVKKSFYCNTEFIFCKYHPNSLKYCSNIFNLKF